MYLLNSAQLAYITEDGVLPVLKFNYASYFIVILLPPRFPHPFYLQPYKLPNTSGAAAEQGVGEEGGPGKVFFFN